MRPEVLFCKTGAGQAVPLYASTVPAGFPSPADDFIDRALDLNEHLVRHPAATFFVRARGDSMINAGIYPGSLLVVDRSLQACPGHIIIAVLDGEFTVKRLKKEQGAVVLYPENPRYAPVRVAEGQDFEVWGVVVHVIRSFA